MTYRVRLGGRDFAGLLLPDSGRVVGKGATKRTLHTFTVFMPEAQVVSGVKVVADKKKLKERTATKEPS